MNKKMIFTVLIIISLIVIGTGVYLILNAEDVDDKVKPSVQDNMKDDALNVIIEKIGEDKDNYSFKEIDEEGHYVFNKKDEESVEIIVDVKNNSYLVKKNDAENDNESVEMDDNSDSYLVIK